MTILIFPMNVARSSRFCNQRLQNFFFKRKQFFVAFHVCNKTIFSLISFVVLKLINSCNIFLCIVAHKITSALTIFPYVVAFPSRQNFCVVNYSIQVFSNKYCLNSKLPKIVILSQKTSCCSLTSESIIMNPLTTFCSKYLFLNFDDSSTIPHRHGPITY